MKAYSPVISDKVNASAAAARSSGFNPSARVFAPPVQLRAPDRSESDVVQKNADLDAVKATFNEQQGVVPGKEGLIAGIGGLIRSISDGSRNLGVLAEIRNGMDVVLSAFTDGLVINGLGEDRVLLLKIKRDITDARMICEEKYRKALSMSTNTQAAAIKTEAYDNLNDAWTTVMENVGEVQRIISATEKTGEREKRPMPGDKTDDSIDIRSIKLAEQVRSDGFNPHIVLGLPTAGAHIGARVAGALNVGQARIEDMASLVTLRPRYVKPTADDGRRRPEDMNRDNAEMLQNEVAVRLQTLLGDPAVDKIARVLVVDDFSLSGVSLIQAKAKIEVALEAVGYGHQVRTAIGRYQAGHLRDQLGERGETDNPIDYVVGSIHSGRRSELKDSLLDEDGHYPKEELMEESQEWERGWTETGLDALRIAGLAPAAVNRRCCCFITTACVEARGLPDDCEELTVLRHFRDNYLINKENGVELLRIYYIWSPEIVRSIRRREDEEDILEHLYQIIRQCVDAINRQDNEFAYRTYCQMMLKLKNQFLPGLALPIPDIS